MPHCCLWRHSRPAPGLLTPEHPRLPFCGRIARLAGKTRTSPPAPQMRPLAEGLRAKGLAPELHMPPRTRLPPANQPLELEPPPDRKAEGPGEARKAAPDQDEADKGPTLHGHRRPARPASRPLVARRRDPHAHARCRRRRQFRPFRHADGHGRRRDRPLPPPSALRPFRPRLARPRPLRPVGRPRLDAALCAAAPHRLCRDDAAADQGFPAMGFAHRGPSRIRPCRRDRDDDRPARPGAGQCRGLRHRRGIAARPLRRGSRRPPHLVHRRRRLPDGGHQPGGDHARRNAAALAPDRALRRQRHHHRRPHLHHRRDRPARPLRRVRLACPGHRRPRSGRHRRGPACRQGRPAPLAHRLQDPYRARFLGPGHGQGPRRADGGETHRRYQGGLWLAPPPHHHPPPAQCPLGSDWRTRRTSSTSRCADSTRACVARVMPT